MQRFSENVTMKGNSMYIYKILNDCEGLSKTTGAFDSASLTLFQIDVTSKATYPSMNIDGELI